MTEEVEKLMAQGNWEGAQAQCIELIARNPSNARLHGYLGLCLFRRNLFEPAADSFRKALTLDEKFWEAALKLAQCLDRLLRYEEALTAARVAHKLRPSDPTINVLVNGLERQVTETLPGVQTGVRHNVSLASE